MTIDALSKLFEWGTIARLPFAVGAYLESAIQLVGEVLVGDAVFEKPCLRAAGDIPKDGRMNSTQRRAQTGVAGRTLDNCRTKVMAREVASVPYGSEFFSAQYEGAMRSARVVVPMIVEMIRPQSVVDFGCGLGAWLRSFAELGVEDIMGLDGEYVEHSQLLIDRARFRAVDLKETVILDRRYDVAVCVEVAEHLPPQRAPGLVADLVNAAPVVVFSAAIPSQGGVEHLNEQWPSYWTDLFGLHDYERVDTIRARIRDDYRVEFWYRQNLVMFVESGSLAKYSSLATRTSLNGCGQEEWVYAPLYAGLHAAFSGPLSMRRILRELPSAGLRVASRLLARLRDAAVYPVQRVQRILRPPKMI